MILPGDRVSVAPDVVLTRSGLHDAVLDAVVPVNAAARQIVEWADGRSVSELAEALAERFPEARERAAADVLAFVWTLNRRCLVQVSCRGGRMRLLGRALLTSPRLLPFGVMPAFPRTRRRLDTSSGRSAVRTVVRALGPHCLLLSGLLGTLGALASLAAGTGAPWLLATVVAGSALGLVVHEAAHAAALAPLRCYLAIGLVGAAVVHAPLDARRRARAAAAGPVAAAATGFAGLAIAAAVASSELALASLFALTQIVGLTIVAQDGRTACLVR